jgi:hypothetical protein
MSQQLNMLSNLGKYGRVKSAGEAAVDSLFLLCCCELPMLERVVFGTFNYN